MTTSSTVPRIPTMNWVAAAWFPLLFTWFFPVMIRAGLNSLIFWITYIALWACAAMHGRLTKEQLTLVRTRLRPLAGACTIACAFLVAYCAIRLSTENSLRTGQIRTLLIESALASFCAVSALVSSYKQNPS